MTKKQAKNIPILKTRGTKIGSKFFRETFKTIACDNGCENLEFEGIERSCITNMQ